jgi:hypothetical protein
VRRDLASAIRLLALPTAAVLLVAAFVPGRLSVAVRIYALVVCVVALGLGVVALRRAYPAASPIRKRASSRPEPPPAADMATGARQPRRRRRLRPPLPPVPRIRNLTSGLCAPIIC